MFPSMKMEEYMEFELFGIFRVKLVATNTVLGSPGTDFMHMRVNTLLLFLACNLTINIRLLGFSYGA